MDISISDLLCRSLERRGSLSIEVRQDQDLALELKAKCRVVGHRLSTTSGAEAALALARVHANFKILTLVAHSLDDDEIPGRLEVLSRPFTSERFMNCVDLLLEE